MESEIWVGRSDTKHSEPDLETFDIKRNLTTERQSETVTSHDFLLYFDYRRQLTSEVEETIRVLVGVTY